MPERAVATTKKPEAKQTCSNSCKQNMGFNSSGPTADMILQLQRTAGNRAVQKLIKSGALQAKLRIGQPNDMHEQEADRVAEKVMRMPEPEVSNEIKAPKKATANLVQLKCPECKLKKDDEEKILQAKEISDSTPEVTPEMESNVSVIQSGGQPLPDSARAFFEPRFGQDFSKVRLRTDTNAAELSRVINARAFTVGQTISFGSCQYSPETSSGKRLLAHELTHVVQQSSSSVSRQTIRRQEESYEEPIFEPTDVELETLEEGQQVEQVGVVQTDDGANLWLQPKHGGSKLGLLPQNTRLFVDRKVGVGWYEVYVEGHQRGLSLPVSEGTHGYIAASCINTDLPDPSAWLFRITKSGQGALEVAREVYKDHFKVTWGKDYRYLVNVLVAINEAKKRNFFYKDNPKDDWDKAKTMKEGQIWVPGLELINALHGQVSSGSISYEILTTLADIAVGVAAFIVGLLHGALMSVADIFVGAYDLIKMAGEIIIKLFKGTLISDAKDFLEEISKIKISDIIEMVGAKWNHPNVWDCWKFRGYVIGYAIVEILLMIFSVGVVTAIKWAGKVGKVGKLAEYLSKLPKVQKVINAAKALKGKGVDEIRTALKAAHSLSEAHGWAAKVLRIPMSMLRRLSELDIGKLKKLPQWARERFARLSLKVKLFICGCASPCKVDFRKIENYLRELAAKGAKGAKKLSSVDDVLNALPRELNKSKIYQKLRKKNSALMAAIKEAGLTDADFSKLLHFLPEGGVKSPAEAYKLFSRYMTGVIPSKTGKDIKRLNEILAKIVKAEPNRGKPLKGSMFEQWVALYVPKLSSRTLKRITFDLKRLLKRKSPPFSRLVDKWVKGEIWEIKHQLGKVPNDQVADYAELLGKVAPDGNIVKSVNYLFPSKEAAELNKHLANVSGFTVYYIDEATNKLAKLMTN